MTSTGSGDRPRIVVGVDGSPESIGALRWAAGYAALVAADVDAVTVWQQPIRFSAAVAIPYDWDPRQDATDTLADVVKQVYEQESPDGVRLVVREGNPAKELVGQAEGALLLVVGSRGRGGFTGLLLGSVSGSVAAHAHCPVLVMHGEAAPPAAPAG